MELPDEFKNVPTLPQYLNWLKEAFIKLMHDRSIGFGSVGGIWSLSISDYSRRLGLSDSEHDYFETMIRGIDSVYINYINTKDKDEKPKRSNR